MTQMLGLSGRYVGIRKKWYGQRRVLAFSNMGAVRDDSDDEIKAAPADKQK